MEGGLTKCVKRLKKKGVGRMKKITKERISERWNNRDKELDEMRAIWWVGITCMGIALMIFGAP